MKYIGRWKDELIFVAVILLVIVGLFVLLKDKTVKLGQQNMNATETLTTSTISQGISSPVKIASANTAASMRLISNVCGDSVFVIFSSSTITSSTWPTGTAGVLITASTTLELYGDKLWNGNIWAGKNATGTCVVSVTEL